MPETTQGIASHRWPGGNTAIPAFYGWSDQLAATTALLQSNIISVDIFALRRNSGDGCEAVAPLDTTAVSIAPGETITVDVVVANRGVGHSFPAELRDIFEAWLEFRATDDSGRLLLHSGAVRADGTLDWDAHAYRAVPIGDDGEPITKHDIWNTRVTALDRHIAAGRADLARFRFVVPDDVSGPITLTGRWPNISYDIDVLPGIDNNLGRPLFLPRVNDGIVMPLDANNVVTQDTVYELPVLGGEPPIKVTARAGTRITFPPDITDKRLSVTRIAKNRAPMPLEDGRATNLYISVQPTGAIFDPPLQVSFPNLDRQPANAQVLLMSFDHDAGRYVQVGTGHVSADGGNVQSAPGGGIRVGAWHAFPPEPPQPEATVLAHVQIKGNPAFEGKVIIEDLVYVQGKQATLMTAPEALVSADQLHYMATISLTPGTAASVTDVEASFQVASITVEGPGSVTRGDPATFTVSDLPKGVRISAWQFSDGTNIVRRRTNIGSTTWSGTMVTGGEMKVTVRSLRSASDISTTIVTTQPVGEKANLQACSCVEAFIK